MYRERRIRQEILGPIKVLDGLFFGDHFSSKDMDFLTNNRIGRIINLCSRSLSNMWVGYGIEYFSFAWNESDSHIVKHGDAGQISKIIAIIEETLDQGNAILVHSMHGKNRSVFAVCCFLMYRYS